MVKIVVVVPVYQQGAALSGTLRRIGEQRVPIIVVNDGSDFRESALVQNACRRNGALLLERSCNGGKGAAVIDGLREAERRGYSHIFQIDADGQHNINRVAEFIRATRQNPGALVLGYPRYDSSAPTARKLGRWLTYFWVCVNSCSLKIRDAMCGFRVYPITGVLHIVEKSKIGKRMEFDIEVCVRACWAGLECVNLPVEVIYPEGGHSNFRMLEDNLIISRMHARLFFAMLSRLPRLLARPMRRLFDNGGAQR